MLTNEILRVTVVFFLIVLVGVQLIPTQRNEGYISFNIND